MLVLLASLGFLPRLGMEFIPTLDEGAIAINVVRLPNASLEGSVVIAQEIEKRALRFAEVATVVTKTGRAEISEDPMGPEQSDGFRMLKPRAAWQTGRVEQPQARVGRGDEPAVVQPRADVAGGGVRETAREETLSRAADLLAKARLAHGNAASRSKALRKKSSEPKFPDFSAR